MEVVFERCAGIDVHKKTVVVCINVPGHREVRTFETVTSHLLRMVDWLTREKIEIVAMESTGVYWKPVWNILEGSECQLMLVNAHHIKQVPGRKTDVKDAEWIAELLRHGLLTASNVPDRDRRELQELVRFRRSVTNERARTVNRLQKVLEGANIKLASVVTDISGKSGREILKEMSQGQTDVARLVELARGRLIKKRSSLEEALLGRVHDHQRFMLKVLLKTLEEQDETIKQLDAEVEERMHPFDDLIQLLDPIPGIAVRGAQDLLATIGTDMSQYPSADHLASWLRLCPGNSRSANKRLTGKTAPGTPFGKSLMVQLAWGAIRTNRSYYQSMFKRISGRRGAKRAAVAVAHAMIVAIYHILSKKIPYVELGANWYDAVNRDKVKKRSIRRLEKLGFKVELTETAA